MSGPGGGTPQHAGPSALSSKLDEFRLRVCSEGSALHGQDAAQRRAKRLATSPPHDPIDLELDPPPLSDAGLRGIKDELSAHDITFASINATSKESVNRKKELEEVIAAYRRAVDDLMMAYIKIKTERDTTAKIWKMMRSTSRGDSGSDLGIEIAGAVQESTGAAIRGMLGEWHARESERTKALVTEMTASMSGQFEGCVRRAVETLASFREAPSVPQIAGRSYAGAVRASGAVAGPQLPSGRRELRDQSRLETIEVVPGENMSKNLPDSEATCRAVLTSIKPSEAGIKVDRVIKGRNKTVRIVADQDEISRLRPMLDNLGMEVKRVDKLNPRLRIRDIPVGTDKSLFVKDLIKQNLDGASEEDIRLVYWSPAKGRMGPAAVIEVSPDIRIRLLNQGRVYLGWSSCRVADHLRVLQCFKCLGFGHTANNCQAGSDTCGHCDNVHNSVDNLNVGRLDGFVCPICLRSFSSKIGLGLHKKKKHPVEYNEEIVVARVRPRWTDEEIRLLAIDEAGAPPQTRSMNSYLLERRGDDRSLESIKGVRRKQAYKDLVAEYRGQLLDQRIDESLSQPDARPIAAMVDGVPLSGSVAAKDWLLAKCDSIIPEMNGGIWIRTAIRRLEEGQSPEGALDDWWNNVFSDLEVTGRKRVARGPRAIPVLSKRKARRIEYRRMQQLWRTNMTKAAHKVLDGDAGSLPHPTLAAQLGFWKPVLEAESVDLAWPFAVGHPGVAVGDLWSPITEGEVINIRLPRTSSPGLDGLTVHRWFTEVPAILRATILNIFMATGWVPPRFRHSRTVLIPKSSDLMDPAYYRPISVSSVILRHFHKILARRVAACELLDVRQRAFIAADGCAENVAVLSAILFDARTNRRQLHVITLDVRKAFDTVSHNAIRYVLSKHGMPQIMVEYLSTLYRTAAVRLEVDGEFSDEILPGRGVRQGDPLSPLLFNLIMNEILAEVPDQVGYCMMDRNVNALAFADDLVLIGATRDGAQRSLERVMAALYRFGLELAPAKCAAFSLVPCGKTKRIKILTDPQFVAGDRPIPQLGVLHTVRYLGVRFGETGPVIQGVELLPLLERITRAPLKPQQRLKILRTYLIPRYTHNLVLGRVSYSMLRKLDKQTRAAVRRWLVLPDDVPVAFFHCPIKQGGLGIQSFETAIPRLTLLRLNRLKDSQYEMARVVGSSAWADRRMRWCRFARRRDEDWPSELHAKVDGFELREAGNVSVSTRWLDDAMVHIPSSDWLQYVKVWINALPTRIRTTRGSRRLREDVNCRGGCGVQETAAHVVQQCFRTHGGRIMRHDAVASALAGELQRGGYNVHRERVFRTREGVRKPDILAAKGTHGHVLDVQIISGARPLSDGHDRKRSYYANNADLLARISALLQVPVRNLDVSTVTLSWRGVWARESAAVLTSLGVSKAVLRGITTRVLKGSYMNFSRFNQTTATCRGRANLRMSGWGPP
ncbi:reverse transcriptase [Lasius niger]|uniref:Reverse transcriptase n=1 Tax=Lasius niger TaxID=67767 RepID=A0A0J7KIZ7_LASNI|nr:reverse transcriptase [Lasius niger]